MALGYIELRERAAVLRALIQQTHGEIAVAETNAVVRRRLLSQLENGDRVMSDRDRFELENEIDDALLEESIHRSHLSDLLEELAHIERDIDAWVRPEDGRADRPVRTVLTQQPPAHTVAEADIVDLTRDLEPLMQLADAYEADDANPPDLRYAVAQRARTLRGELHMHGDVAHDAILITRSAAFLMATLANELQGKVDDREAQAGRDIAEAAQDLPDDDTAVKAATDMVDALEHVATPPPPPGEPQKTLRRRALEGAAAGGGAAAAKPAGEYVGRTLGALVRAGWALLKARFPWLPDLP